MNPNKFLTNGKTKLVKGSILNPELGNLRLIFVPCSQSGLPNTRLHHLLETKWKQTNVELKGWRASNINFKLGSIQTTAVQSDTWIVHALCMNDNNETDEKALATCVKKLSDLAKYEKGSVHVSMLTVEENPTIGDLFLTKCIENGVSVYFYDQTQVSTAVEQQLE
jgi:hypothetical protein